MVELVPRIDSREAAMVIEEFVADYVDRSGLRGAVVGLSGGLDSAMVAKVAARSLGRAKVRGFFLPDGKRSGEATDVRLAAKAAGISLETVDIGPVVDALTEALGSKAAGRALVNVPPRVRMIVLYAKAASSRALVLGTGNKSELLTGYFTKFGDGGSDISPLGDLYKTQVVELAKFYRLPPRLVKKPPTAGLYPGQTDAKELGLPYAKLDRILYGLELQLPLETIVKRSGESLAVVSRVAGLVNSSQHKRAGFIIPKIGHRTIGLDWRAPPSRAV